MANYSPAGMALGFGRAGVAASDYGNNGGLGGMLKGQVQDETEEEKLRRKLGLSALQSGGAFSGGSPAARSLFGGLGGINLKL